MFAHIDVCTHREVYGFSLVLCVKGYVCACVKMHVCANSCVFARTERVGAPMACESAQTPVRRCVADVYVFARA